MHNKHKSHNKQTDLYEHANAARHEHEVAGVLVEEVEEDDERGQTAPHHHPHWQANHSLAFLPVADVVFESQKVEEEMEGSHDEGEHEEVEVCVCENTFDLISVFFCEAWRMLT